MSQELSLSGAIFVWQWGGSSDWSFVNKAVRPLVHQHLEKEIRSHHDREDREQEILIKILECVRSRLIKALRPDHPSPKFGLRAFVNRFCRNSVVSHYRAQARLAQTESSLDMPGGLDGRAYHGSEDVNYAHVVEFADELKLDQRDVSMIWSLCAGNAPCQVAVQLEIHRSTVSKRLTSINTKLDEYRAKQRR
jgi:DNA-directed RNA polymerase specialized sigma24 family protein